MYECPAVTPVGDVDDVVLGIASLGGDIDLTLVCGDFEFGDDALDDSPLPALR